MNYNASPVRYLTLASDGGGPGSLAQLRIIEEYTSRLSHDQGVDADAIFPADLFDAIGGVGFGAYVYLYRLFFSS